MTRLKNLKIKLHCALLEIESLSEEVRKLKEHIQKICDMPAVEFELKKEDLRNYEDE